MGMEIERKFLIDPSVLGKLENGVSMKQAYIQTVDKTVVRIRVAGDEAFITMKGAPVGFSCSEFEYKIPVKDAEEMISELCSPEMVHKTRYKIPHAGHTWELDIFHGDNEGLIVAEVELSSEDEKVNLPKWIKEEVTGDVKYFNANLLKTPYSKWSEPKNVAPDFKRVFPR